MTKEQVLDYISKLEWQAEDWNKSDVQKEIECAVAKFVVYKLDPDTHEAYAHKYHMSKEDALADYNSRTTNDHLCYCCISEMRGDWREQRNIHGSLMD